ncbi:MAG: L-threonylcarbamoyladenylate synthase [Breznakibacter sp.]|nr:threonylcarbamoyl-AMP synthase [Breznakibacter sp.]
MFKSEDLNKALEVLRAGGLILYPTDTIWGIGCDATNADAVAKLYQLKRREECKSMLVLVDAPMRIQSYIREVPDVAWDLMELSDKPLTIIFDGAKNLATNLLATDGSIGIRVTGEKFSKELCMRFKRPIVSTSANISGHPSPKYFAEIDGEIVAGVDYVVEYRQDDKATRESSSIIKLGAGGVVKVIRS